MQDDFERLLDPSERGYALSIVREWGDEELPRKHGEIYAETIDRLIVRPLGWWLEVQGHDRNTATDAAQALYLRAMDVKSLFSNQRFVVTETIGALDREWTEFQLAMGHGAIARAERDEKRKSQWRKAGGEANKGRRGPFRNAIDRLAEALRTKDAETVLAEIRRDCDDESDLLDDLRAARDTPVKIRFQQAPDSATDNNAAIDFVVIDTGKEESRTIKTMKNYLA